MQKNEYRVCDGVDWINGARVPKDRKVELTATEALYDEGLGRIKLLKRSSGEKPETETGEEQPAGSAKNG